MPDTKPDEASDAVSRSLYQLKLLDVINSLGSKAIRWGVGLMMVYWLASAVKELAGQETYADIFLGFMGSLTIEKGLCYGVGAVGVEYGLVEKKFRRDRTENMAKRIQELEQGIDPERTSSNITVRGTTRPEDKP